MLDKFRETAITWDKANRKIYESLRVSAGDNKGRKLSVQLVNDGVIEDLSGANLSLFWETRDKTNKGLDAFTDVDATKGEFEIYYTTGMLSNEGTLNANLVLVDTSGRVVSEPFTINVFKGIDDDAIQSSDSFTALTEALAQVGTINNKADRAELLALESTFEQNKLSVEQQLQQTEQSLTAQLAQKANQADVRKKSVPISLNDADAEFIAAVQNKEGETTFNLLSEPRNYSVSHTKTNFVTTGKNLFDKDTAELGYTLASDGTKTVREDEFISDYIPVEPNTEYTRVRNYRIAFYDNNQTPISVVLTPTFTTPTNCAYIRIAGYITTIDSEQVELGGVNTSYESYVLDIKKLKINEDIKSLESDTAGLKDRVDKSEKGIRALKRNPINPEVGEMWLFLPSVNLFVNGGFETGDLSNWGTHDVGSLTRETGVSSAAGDFVDVDGNYGYKVSLTSHPEGASSHTFYQVLRSTEGDLNKLSDFSLRFKPISTETSEQNPETDSNAVFVRLQVNAFDLASGGSNISDVTNHRSNIYLFGATQYTNATHKQDIVEMDKWATITEDIRAFVTERLTAGYSWGDVNRVEITAYTYAAASAGTNRIGVRFDSFMAVGE